MGKFNWQDVKTALSNIAGYAWASIKHMAKYLAFCAAALAIALSVGGAIMHYPLYSAIALVLGAFVTVFVIELRTVRWIREKEEQQEAYWAEKSKPSHPEYKEQQ